MEESIIVGNKLIADFMGLKIGVDKYSWRIGCTVPLQEKHLNYHQEWGWLMAVVEKIESLGYYTQISRNEDLNSFYIFEGVPSYVRREENIICYTDFKYHKKIESVYEAVIQFIEWHNKEQSAQVSDTTEVK